MSDELLYMPSTIEEALAHLCEEAGELIQECGKALRFGIYNHHPKEPDKRNIDRIRTEFNDVRKRMMVLENLITSLEGRFR